jgi:hypothetical protein
MSKNPFIVIFIEWRRKSFKSLDFNFVSKDFKYDDEEEVVSGIKLSCRYLKYAKYKLVGDSDHHVYENIIVVKEAAIDVERARKGYFTEFIQYLTKQYDVVVLENVISKWLRKKLDANTAWVRQSGTHTYVLLCVHDDDDEKLMPFVGQTRYRSAL